MTTERGSFGEPGDPPNEGAVVNENKGYGFEIDGEWYDLPRFSAFDLNEAEIMYDISGVVLEDFAPLHPDSDEALKKLHETANMQRIKDPRFKRALAHIAYRRRHSDLTFDEIADATGKLNALDLSLAVLGGDDESPPAPSSPKPQDGETSTSSTSSSEASGTPSGSGSGAPVAILARTGTGG